MQAFIILSLIFVACANHSIIHDVSNGGLLLSENLRTNSSHFSAEGITGINPRIGGGSIANVSQFPWIVSVYTIKKSVPYICGGSIINKRTILTAAHCVFGIQPSKVTVNVDSINLGSIGLLVNVSEIKTHKSYFNGTKDYDIAILITATEMPIDGKKLKPVLLVPQEPSPGTKVIIAGWGRTNKYEHISDVLMFTTIKIIDRKTCQSMFKNLTARMICAGDNEKGKRTCKGDSGGPVTQNGTQVGIVSFGSKICSQDGSPSFFTNVAYFHLWINSNKA